MTYYLSYVWVTELCKPKDLFHPNFMPQEEIDSMELNLRHTSSKLCGASEEPWKINLFINVPEHLIPSTIMIFKKSFGSNLEIINFYNAKISQEKYRDFFQVLKCLSDEQSSLCLSTNSGLNRKYQMGEIADMAKHAISENVLGVVGDINMLVCKKPNDELLHEKNGWGTEPFFFYTPNASSEYCRAHSLSVFHTDVDREFLKNPIGFCRQNSDAVFADTWQESWVKFNPTNSTQDEF